MPRGEDSSQQLPLLLVQAPEQRKKLNSHLGQERSRAVMNACVSLRLPPELPMPSVQRIRDTPSHIPYQHPYLTDAAGRHPTHHGVQLMGRLELGRP